MTSFHRIPPHHHADPYPPSTPPQRGSKASHSGDDEHLLRSQLRDLGLRIEVMAADGNCFFRALSDQRWGDDSHHEALRRDVISYMRANRTDFEPFIEDDEKWDTYIARMAEDGTWAGNLELQAASVVCFANLCVHQAEQPRWEIINYAYAKDRYFHVAYQDGDHYNSVRLLSEDRFDRYDSDQQQPGGPISLSKLESGFDAFRPNKKREPSGNVVNETLQLSGNVGKKTRARELLRLFDGCVDSASAALKNEVSYKGVLRGGVGDDPVPGLLDAMHEKNETEAGDEINAEDETSDGDVSEDDWEPVVYKKGTRGGGGKRVGRRRDDTLDEQVAALRI